MRIACGFLMVSLALLPAFAGQATPPEKPAAQEKPQRVDLHGDPLPKGALQRLGTIRYRQESPIAAFAFAPDGKTFATAANTHNGEDSSIHLWDTATGKEMLRCGGIPTDVKQIVYAPDGKTVAAGCGRHVLFWDVGSGKKLRQFEAHTYEISCLAWSPDGKTIAVGGWSQGGNFSHTVRLFDAETGKLVSVSDEHKLLINVLAFSPDSKRLASSSPGSIFIWDVVTGKKLHQVDCPTQMVTFGVYRRSLAFSPDLARVAFLTEAGAGLDLQVWDIAAGKKVWGFEAHDQSFQFSADGKFLVVGSANAAIQLMDAETGRCMRSFVGHEGVGCQVAGIDPTGKYVATIRGPVASGDGIVRLWDMESGKELSGTDGHVDAVILARATHDGKWVVTTGRDRTLRLWESATGRLVSSLADFDWGTPAMAAAGRVAALDGQGTMHLLDIPEFKPRPLPGGKHSKPTHFTLSPDGKVLAVSVWPPPGSPMLKSKESLIDVQSGEILVDLNNAFSALMAFSADGQILATVSDTIELWQSSTGKKLIAIPAPIIEIDENLENPGWTRLLDVAFSSDGRWLARSGTYHNKGHVISKLSVWEVATGQLVAEIADKSYPATAIAFAPDGLTLVTCSGTESRQVEDRGAKFWDWGDGQLAGKLEGHSGSVKAVAFSPDGSQLLTGSSDGTVLIWDAAALPKAKTPVARKLRPDELAALWADLAGMDARKALQAMTTMRADGKETIDFLQTRLQPAKSLPQEELNRLVAELDNQTYGVRAKAFAALENQGEMAESTLRKALTDNVTPEMRQRLRLLLAKLETFTPAPADLRKLRALAVLEYIGDAEACKLIAALAAGSIEARLTREARAALDRLTRRREASSR